MSLKRAEERGGWGRPIQREPMVLGLLKFVVVLGLLAFVGLSGFAYLGDLSPNLTERSVPVTLDAD